MKETFIFPEIEYVRPDFDKIGKAAEELAEKIKEASSYDEVRDCLKKSEAANAHLETMTTIVYIRHTLDTTDVFYEKENAYIESARPMVMPKLLAVNEAFMNSDFKGQLEEEYGKQMFVDMELKKKTFCEENILLMQREAELTSEYQKIMATAELPFQGEIQNLSGIQLFLSIRTEKCVRLLIRHIRISFMQRKRDWNRFGMNS